MIKFIHCPAAIVRKSFFNPNTLGSGEGRPEIYIVVKDFDNKVWYTQLSHSLVSLVVNYAAARRRYVHFGWCLGRNHIISSTSSLSFSLSVTVHVVTFMCSERRTIWLFFSMTMTWPWHDSFFNLLHSSVVRCARRSSVIYYIALNFSGSIVFRDLDSTRPLSLRPLASSEFFNVLSSCTLPPPI